MKDLTLVAGLALFAPLSAFAAQPMNSGAPPTSAAQEAGSPAELSAGDWSSIREAYEAHRHAAVATEGGFETFNHGLGWRTRFDERGATTRPQQGDWSWGIELASWGYEGHALAVDKAQDLRAQGQRVSRDWDESLTEWWINDTRGLEHGFTVHAPPTAAAGDALVFELNVLGDLQPQVKTGQRGARFLAEDGTSILMYDGLLAFDADGVDLNARMETADGGLRLIVQATDARYPITVDPLVHVTYMKASNTDVLDSFGSSMAISGDTLVVGATSEDSAATGINPGPLAEADNTAGSAGAAYVFVRSGSVWSQQAYLKASNTDINDGFGASVSISGDTIVVGALGESSNATGVNAGAAAEADNSAASSGAAYVFVRSGSVWSQQAYLKASNTDALDAFGLSVNVAGETILVGASQESSNATGVNSGATAEADNSAVRAGAAYVFVRSGTVWSQQAYLKASNTDTNDSFGASVAISGDTAVVGAWGEGSSATGVNPGPQGEADNSASAAGAAYVFLRSGTGWSQQAYIKASNPGSLDFFGTSLAISGDTLVAGASQESSMATGVNAGAAAEADDSASEAGAAYVFSRSGSVWSQQAYLKASNTDAGDQFGTAVAISGSNVIVGAWREDGNAEGFDPGALAEANNAASSAGAAYQFGASGSVWSQLAYIKASNTDANDRFGRSVAISGSLVLVGADRESSSATGVNPGMNAQADNGKFGSGAIYVLDNVHPLGALICSPAIPNSTGNPASISALGSEVALDNDVSFFAVDLPASTMAILATSPSLGTVPGAGGGAGTLCIASPTIGRHGVLLSSATGTLNFTVDLTAIPLPNATTAVLAGDTRYWQFWYRDGATTNFSDAIQIDFQ